jgi:hypothetical protein
MLIPYSKLPSNSKVFIYQSNREIKEKELLIITQHLDEFSQNWVTHGKPVRNAFKVFNYFLCFFIDESSYQTSGCSIDSLVGLIKSIGIRFDIDFFNRNNIAYLDKVTTKLITITDFKLFISPNTIVYNNLVQTKSDFENHWKIPVKESWLKRYLN